ncbi:MAG: hypothetical protein WAZ30_16185, partial [Syntrophorhabdus sp.]
ADSGRIRTSSSIGSEKASEGAGWQETPAAHARCVLRISALNVSIFDKDGPSGQLANPDQIKDWFTIQ